MRMLPFRTAPLRSLLLTVTALCALTPAAQAEEAAFEGWDINGYNTLRHDYYDIDGDQSSSPFAFHGGHSYDEWSFNASKDFSAFRRARIQMFGVVNGSNYRLPQEGFVPERLSFFYENGEARVPYRLELGDYYSGISYRTQQRMMKGASLEFQPDLGGQTRHSILLFDGSNLPYYHAMDMDDDAATGASWLMENATIGRLALNGLYNRQDEPTATLTGMDNDQVITSVAWEKDVRAGAQNLTLNGELALFDGDYAFMKDRSDTGALAEIAGYSMSQSFPVDYRLRYERYGTDYRPNGALITPDRQSYEAHAGWRFETGAQLRGRAQKFEDAFDSTNQQDTDVLGVQLLGPLFGSLAPEITGSADLFTQSIEDDFRSVDRDTDTFNFALSRPFEAGWTGELSGFWQDVRDAAATNYDSETRQVGIGFYYPVSLGDFTGTIHPGIVLRDVDFTAGAGSKEWEPALAVQLANERHRISASYGYLRQNRTSLTTLADTAVQNASFDYAFLFAGNHEIGISGSYFDRNIDASLDTDAYRIGAYWTVHFNKPAQGKAAYGDSTAPALADGGMAAAPVLNLANAYLLSEITPGMKLADAQSRLAAYNLTAPAKLPRALAYEVNLLKSIPARQRLVLQTANGKVQKTALLVDTDTMAAQQSLLQTYESIKEALVRVYGKPDNVIEEGALTGNALAAIVTGSAIRVTEWETEGGILRLGLPRTVDGSPRVEIHHAASFPSPRSNNWGMSDIR